MHVTIVEKSGKRFPAVYVCIGFVVFAMAVVILGYMTRSRRYAILPFPTDNDESEQLAAQLDQDPSVDSGETKMRPGFQDKELPYTEIKSNSLDTDWLKGLLLPESSRKEEIPDDTLDKPFTDEGFRNGQMEYPVTEDDNGGLSDTPPVDNSNHASQFTNYANQTTNSSQTPLSILLGLATSSQSKENISVGTETHTIGIGYETSFVSGLGPNDSYSQTTMLTDSSMPTTPPTTNVEAPRCLEYMTYSSVKDFVAHQIQSQSDSEMNNLQDFQRALNTDSRLGVIDVGATMGFYSLVAAKMGRTALVVEPNHACALQIQRMLQNSNMMTSVAFLEVGISNTTGYGRLSDGNSMGPTLVQVPEEEVTLERLSDHVLFKIMTLNQLSYHVNFETAILKIDIMSSQPLVFDEAQILFDTVNIPYIFMDWEYSSDRDEMIKRTIQFLQSNDFRPSERLQNGFGLTAAFCEFWPKRVIWAKRYQWNN